mmetsp:Transcript_11875/g.18218  ORF Transcript_11875/g.18218 Transcript_11875/m.18218 type:complete len:353 (-) Transcript_11875:74-1132(-)
MPRPEAILFLSVSSEQTMSLSSSSGKEISVLLLRHGEREDEVNLYENPEDYKLLSKKEKLDPPLTSTGYDQAAEAFSKIFRTNSSQNEKPTALFCSPLKRTVGTALMVASAVDNKNNSHIVLPTNAEGKSSPTNSIPIVMMNGLCHCAARVYNIGGARVAVSKGLVDCAFNDTLASTLPSLLRTMRQGQSLRDGQSLPSTVQFWKEDSNTSFAPMTDSFSILTNPTMMISENNGEKQHITDDDFHRTVNRAVFQTAQAGLNKCILVTHREGIRYFARTVCRDTSRFSTPYCCIGKFRAKIEYYTDNDTDSNSSTSYKVEWKFFGVTQFENFQPFSTVKGEEKSQDQGKEAGL